MKQHNTITFEAKIEIIGINPFVFVPDKILKSIFEQAGKDKGHIPIRGTINNHPYKQTLVKYSGEWRLYINTTMLKNSPKRIGEIISITVSFDPESRAIEMSDDFATALKANQEANLVFEQLSTSLQQEIIRYLSRLKTKETLDKNITRAINFLTGKERFIGREKP
ncbi:YdeI/OmpD-associated family protein [Flavobacterium aestivum]|uniref:YdeI/OmpD-associated family protein n=1 Tax=Flavobacterium aestivum TaxID=3003257 RepID=UPI00248264BC|nr:YdeI/OmpD-associated family protein [Flavobacterium aestivum]